MGVTHGRKRGEWSPTRHQPRSQNSALTADFAGPHGTMPDKTENRNMFFNYLLAGFTEHLQ